MAGEAAEVVLEGLDGGTPLGFIAGLGVQRVLAERDGDGSRPRLSWRLLDGWRPVLHGPSSFDAVVDAVAEDAEQWKESSLLGFRYLKLEKKGPKKVGGLRAPIAVFRQWLRDRLDEDDHVSLAAACGLMCESASDPADRTAAPEELKAHGIPYASDAPVDRPVHRTFFDFTSRNAQFLEQVEAIRAHLSRDRIAAGLAEGRGDRGVGRTMDWDPAADTPGAIYTGHARAYLPVAEWLAFRGLAFFPVTTVGARVITTACSGRRLDGELVWPLWEVPAGPATVASLVAYPNIAGLDPRARRALGIAAVFRAALTKKADGYTGMFAPPVPIGSSLPVSAERVAASREPAAPVHPATPFSEETPGSRTAREPGVAVTAASPPPVDWSFEEND